MTAQVLTHHRFRTVPAPEQEAVTNEFAKIAVSTGMDEIVILDPQPGEQVIGEFTSEEADLYVRLHQTVVACDKAYKELAALGHDKIAGALRKAETVRDLPDDLLTDYTEAEKPAVESYYQLKHKVDFLKAALWFMVAERLGVHEFILGCRSKRRIVKLPVRRQ